MWYGRRAGGEVGEAVRSLFRTTGRLTLLLLAAVLLPGATSAAARPALIFDTAPVAAPSPSTTALIAEAAPLPAPAPANALPVRSSRMVLDDTQVIAVYGHPGVPIMGILGAYQPDGAAAEAQRLAAQWDDANGPERGAIGALHLITAVAQPHPMPDGSYLARMAPEVIETYVVAARKHGLLLFIDVQIGMADPLVEAQRLEAFLELPFVHLALDPEFAMRATGGVPGQKIGSVGAADVNAVQRYLAGLVRKHTLPPKLLVVHQFRADMLTGVDAYEDLDEVERVIDMDGWGGAGVKLAHYEAYALAAYSERPAIKLFYQWDVPLLSIEQLLALSVVPDVVIYQ
jgi:hypothetical protein